MSGSDRLPHDHGMTSLLITHTISGSLDAWLDTFSSFEEVRAKAGVTAVRVRHAVDAPNEVSIDLDFESTDEARAFRSYLEAQVWPNSPHLGGVTPQSRILEPLAVGA